MQKQSGRRAFICLWSVLAAQTLPAQVFLNRTPSRIIGHPQLTLTSASPNYVEGREFANPSGAALDTSASPPILYVADTGNNRVLAWRNAQAFSKGAMADLVLGQRDRLSTLPQGPGTSLSTGLSQPTAVAVDLTGNVYVLDAGNNRILRYPRPFAQPDEQKFPDMVLGQPNLSANTPNAGGLSPRSIALAPAGRVFRGGLTFDRSGNLWLSDAGNHRVLRYPGNALATGQNQPAADLVLGQFSFTTNDFNRQGDARNKVAMTSPSGLAVDPAGRVYVCDALNRVLVYATPATGATATRVMGVLILAQGQTAPAVNDISLGRVVNNLAQPPEGIFFIGNTPFVLDTPNNRIVRYDPFEAWPAEGAQFSPPGRQFIGQPDPTSSRPNRGQPEAAEDTFNRPIAAAVAGSEAYVVDSGNHRVLAFGIANGTLGTASRVLGQNEFYQTAPNLVEGRELFLFTGFETGTGGQVSTGAGIVIDTRSNPQRLFIADSYNNRVLGWRDARNVKPGDRADLVIGQRDFSRTLLNEPTNDPNQVTNNGLWEPTGLAIDQAGNLYVADSGNGRILRYPRPFDQGSRPTPDLVLGQANFFSKITDATPRNMNRPHGVALTTEGHLLASDLLHNRVLFFRKPQGGDFQSGQPAEKVFGQPDFTSVARGNLPNRMNSPHHIATDSEDRLYVCDSSNQRMLVFDRVTTASPDPAPALTVAGLSNPHGISVSPNSGDIWVASTTSSRLLHYPPFQRLVFDSRPDFEIQMAQGNYALAVADDGFGNIVALESVNRAALYFPAANVSNAGNGSPRFAPGVYAAVKPVGGGAFGDTTLIFDQIPNPIPMPTTLADLQVLVNDVPSPLHFVSPGQINFMFPLVTPTSGAADILVQRRSTGQVLGTTQVQMSNVAPAFFTTSGDGRGQIAGLNQDEKINSPVNPVARGQFVSLFGTGLGRVPGMPPDGAPTAGALPAGGDLRVRLGDNFIDPSAIVYSGLAPTLIGVWQLTFVVPESAPSGPQVPFAATLSSIATTQAGQVTTIAIR